MPFLRARRGRASCRWSSARARACGRCRGAGSGPGHPLRHPADRRSQRAERRRRVRLTSNSGCRAAEVSGNPGKPRNPGALRAQPSEARAQPSLEAKAATRRRARRSRTTARLSGFSARAGLPPAARWSTVTTTSSTYTVVFFPQVVFTGRLIGEHERRPREAIACTAPSVAIRIAGSSTAGQPTTAPRSAAGGRARSAGAGSPPRRR